MKKSTKYLLILIGSFVLTVILLPVILHYVPQEQIEFNEETTSAICNKREVPIVDMPVTKIELAKSIRVSNVIIESVESVKEQTIEITASADEKYFNAINVEILAETSTLQISDNNQDDMAIDSLVIKIATPSDGRLEVKTYKCHSVSFKNINTEDVQLVSKYSSVADCCDLNFISCNIKTLSFTSLNHEYRYVDFSINCLQSDIESLRVSTVRDFNLQANGNVKSLAINAEGRLEVSINGYDGDIDLQKNDNKVYINRD